MIRVELDRNAVRQFRKLSDSYKRNLGQGLEESVIELGRSSARQLAQKVPPFGLSDSIGRRFMLSIAKQVSRAIKAANVGAVKGSTAAAAHGRARDSKGQVPKGLRVTGRYVQKPIDVGDKERLIDEKQEAAGIAKGAWIAAGVSLTGRAFSGVGRWITRHASRGTSTIRRKGISTEVTLTNHIAWIARLQPTRLVRAAMQAAFRNTTKAMQRKLDKIKP